MSDSEPEVTLTPVEAQRDADWCRKLLARAGLPTADLRADPEPGTASGNLTLYVVEAGGERVGCIGIERYGDAALLRSAVVAEPHRGQGYGRRAVRRLESSARDGGIETLYLLTTTAADFFASLGYEQVSRENVPEAVRGSAEFSELCPDSATVMRRRL